MDKGILLNIKKFKAKLSRDPRQKVHALLAENYRRVGLTGDAVDTCLTGLQVFPSYLFCREVLGRVYLRIGQPAQAREELEAVHRIVKDDVELNRVLAKVYLELGDREKARPLLEALLAKDPFDFEVRNLLSGLDSPEPEASVPESPAAEPQSPAAEPLEVERDSDGDADGVDLFDEPGPDSPKIFDIESIIAESDDVGPVSSREVRSSATDEMLDGLEDVEDVIEAGADRIMASMGDQEPLPKSAVPRTSGPDVFTGKEKELRGAAVLALAHIEIQLLEEALFLLRSLMKEMGGQDSEFSELAKRLEETLLKKEHELESLEDMELARGL